MQRRLNVKERESIRERFDGDMLYRLVADVTRHCASRAHVLRLTPEEVLLELSDVLDGMKEAPGQKHYLCQTTWDMLAYEIRGAGIDVPDDEMEMYVQGVMMTLIVCLALVDAAACRTLAMGLMMELDNYARQSEIASWQQWIGTLVCRMGEDGLRTRMNRYWRGDSYLTDEIHEALEAAVCQEEPVPGITKYIINTGGGAAIMGGSFSEGVEFNNLKKVGQ